MHANVPQYIDVEDKIAFGLTGKQLLWMGGMTALLVAAYTTFDRQLFYIAGLIIIAVFGSFAFWRPQGVSLFSFVGYVFQYFLKPRSYVWKRVFSANAIDFKKATLVQKKKLGPIAKAKQAPRSRDLQKLAWMLDTEGRISSR
jgi:hypothetical protein